MRTNLSGDKFSSKNFMVCFLDVMIRCCEYFHIVSFCLNKMNIGDGNNMNFLAHFSSDFFLPLHRLYRIPINFFHSEFT